MSKILITGGAGFIGAHVAKALMERGDEVVLLDNFDSFVYSAEDKEKRMNEMFERDKRPKLIHGDILDAKLLDTVFAEEKFDKVLHLAALPNPGKSVGVAPQYTLINVNGTINILDACRKHDIVQFVFAGSSSVYNDEQTPFTEDAYPLRPRSPYGASKAAAETFIETWHELYGISTTILRFFSVYGPWGRPDMAPSIFAEHVLSGEELPLTGGRKRDFTYISDVVDGVVAALDTKLDFEIINLGRGEPQDLQEFIAALEKAAGKKMKTVPREAPPGEMEITYADVSKAKKLLGYEPKVSIEEGAQKLIEWMQR